uniref:Cytochrome P450 n=1 Tax=Anopheles christyi TaxID=43041 RepID=A0A182K0X8_9DIPT
MHHPARLKSVICHRFGFSTLLPTRAMLIIAVFVAFFGTFWIYFHFRQRYLFWLDRDVPYLEPTFPVGNVADILNPKIHFAHLIAKLYRQLKDRGDYAGIFFFRDPVLLVLSPEFARTILVKDFNYFVDRGVYSNEEFDPLSANLFFMEGSRWRKLRSKLAPTFTSGKLKSMFHTIVDVGSRLDQYLGERCVRVQRIDIKELLARFMTDVIGSCAFGIECNSLENPNSQFRVMGKRMINLPKLKALKVFFAMMFRKQARALGIRYNDKDMSDFFMKVVRDTIRYRADNDVRRDDFMQLLIDMMKVDGAGAGESLTFEEVAAQAFVFFFGGFETSTTTLTCALHLLSKHPKAQRKARKCVRSTLVKHGNELTYDAIMEMDYIECVINETLRLYPPVASIHRMTSQPYQLPNGEVIPEGVGVIISNLAFHHDPALFPDPLAFKPERFEDKTFAKTNPSYLAFGDGPRMCIAMRFGQLQTRLGLAMLLRKYIFSLEDCDVDRPLPIDPINLMHGPAGALLLLLGSLGSLWIYLHFKQRYQFWAQRNVPFLEPSFPVGNVADTLKPTIHFAYIIEKLYKELKSRGDYVGIYFFRDPVLLVLSPEFARTILVKDFNYFVDRGVYSNEEVDPLSANLFFLEGNRWRKLRSKLAPTFTSGKLKAMFHTIVDVGTRLDQYLAERCSQMQRIDVRQLLACFLTDVIGSCAFGIECNSLDNPNSQFRVMGKRVINLPKLKALKVFFAMMFRKQARALGIRFNDKDVSDFFLNVVRDTIRYREENGVRRDDFMQLLIDMMKQDGTVADDEVLTMEEVAAQAFVFFFAGFETSATTLTFALHLLAKHPEVQKLARNCIKDVLAKHDNKLSYEAVMEMEYIGWIVNETLRMYPPVATLHRITTQPYQLPNGALIPEGVGVILPNLAFQHDSDFFPDPYEFKPERFSVKNDFKNNFSYLPFGEGPRICIGMRFGLLQTRLGLAMLLRNYNFTIDPSEAARPLRIDPINLTHGPEGEVWLNVERIV